MSNSRSETLQVSHIHIGDHNLSAWPTRVLEMFKVQSFSNGYMYYTAFESVKSDNRQYEHSKSYVAKFTGLRNSKL